MWTEFLIIAAVCAVGCSMGFKHFIWFISIGYGFAVSCGSVAILVLAAIHGRLNLLLLLQCTVLFVYGLRLGLFLYLRETKNAAYKKTLDSQTGNDKKMPIFVSIFMWAYSAFLYDGEMSPIFFRNWHGTYGDILPWIGLVISACGVCLEALADKQKSAQKALNPHMVATQGLYKMVRCPNYFGEILTWTGVFVGGVTALQGVWEWVIACVCYVSIVFIMINGAQRLEKRQDGSYGEMPEYQEYIKKTPILFPFLPIYSLNKKK
jgi:steroid 5-alpha reductase family enzyme